MNNEQKAATYNQLMMEYTRIENKISSIRGESFTLNNNQINEIRELEKKLRMIMERASRI
jgi:prefoldin subunit 5